MNRDQIDEYQNFAKEHFGFEFNDPQLFITALTHRSYVNEHKRAALEHNERLEFLGDAILEFVVSDYIFRNYKKPEGVMTAWRAALVRTESIGAASDRLGYDPLVRMSRGERSAPGRSHHKILADCFEATTAAIYLDQGFDAVKKFIQENILSQIDTVINELSWRDDKSYIQEICQKLEEGTIPQYRTIREEGPDHAKEFTIALTVRGKTIASAIGHSKQEAQTLAAREAVKYYEERYPNLDELMSE